MRRPASGLATTMWGTTACGATPWGLQRGGSEA
ncbi:EAST1 family heat-stable enterotoxin [Actinomadura logoneensis]|uniref:EAST1 family heat-stable enterotoxin n=1 Tax=Actinomadura logoneensis TaxID=2293572 RepID=A0A372JUC2_9ACTN|nr:EAST1 family heat-stable enterotoxin [Actinomadura logoneensis]